MAEEESDWNPDTALDEDLLTASSSKSKRQVQSVLDFGSKKEFVRPSPSERRKRSLIWKFVKVDKDDASCHICMLCNERIIAHHNTSNSARHLHDFHSAEWLGAKNAENPNDEDEDIPTDNDNIEPSDEIRKLERKRPLKKLWDNQRKYARTNSKKMKTDENVTRMIAEDFLPYSIVERKGFRRVLNGLDPKYELPDRRTITRSLMPNMVTRIEEILIQRLKDARNLALTFDGWRSVALTDFLLVTGHYLPYQSTEVESVTLALIDCSSVDHSAVGYAQEMQDHVFKRFKLVENKVSVVWATTDNAANMLATAKELKIRHIGCYTHTLQLAVYDILDPKKKGGGANVLNDANDSNVSSEEKIYFFTEDDIFLASIVPNIILAKPSST